MLKQIGPAIAAFIVACLGLWVNPSNVSAFTLPTEQDVQGIENLCGAKNLVDVRSQSVKAEVNAAIKSWDKLQSALRRKQPRKNSPGYFVV